MGVTRGQVNGVVLDSAATIIASYGPLKASDCVLLGSKIDALPVGVAHELFIQPAQWDIGALLSRSLTFYTLMAPAKRACLSDLVIC